MVTRWWPGRVCTLTSIMSTTGAKLVTVPGMGHDLPKGAWPLLLDLIDDHAKARSTDAPTAP